MSRPIALILTLSTLAASISAAAAATTRPSSDPYWVAPMRAVHARFTGRPGSFAQFGDSITVTMAYWAGLRWERKNLSPDAQRAYALVDSYMLKPCWNEWKGPKFGSEGSMTIRWAHQHIDAWLKDLNPETALIMFGTNDLNQVPLAEYEMKLRDVAAKCLANGTIPILSTIPPRSGRLAQCRQFNDIVKKVARELNLPVEDFFAECLRRRPDDWDGSAPKFKSPDRDSYNVLTLISRDGVHPSNPKQFTNDYSEESLNNNGYALRTHLTLLTYADIIQTILNPPAPPSRKN